MLLLASTTDVVRVITSVAASVDVHADYSDIDQSTTASPTFGRTNTAIATAATTTVVAAPGTATIRRNVKYLSVRNAHASLTTVVTVAHFDGTLAVTLFGYALGPGDSLAYVDGGWSYMPGVLGVPVPGRLLAVTTLTAGTTITTNPLTSSARVRLVGGGGGGGGIIAGTISTWGSAGGGGSGGYAEKLFAVTGGTSYTYAIGAAGTGNSGAAGGAGGSSTFLVAGVTVTALGGAGAAAFTTVATAQTVSAGGAGGGLSTNGDINGSGAPGTPGFTLSSTAISGGRGASSPWGGGGLGVVGNVSGAGGAASGRGGGGAGGAAVVPTAQTGGAGTAGAIVVEEYA